MQQHFQRIDRKIAKLLEPGFEILRKRWIAVTLLVLIGRGSTVENDKTTSTKRRISHVFIGNHRMPRKKQF